MTLTQLCYSTKGHLGQYEDWWYLLQNDDGSVEIEHEWDHVNVNGFAKNAGTKTYSLDEGLKEIPGNGYSKAKEILGSQAG